MTLPAPAVDRTCLVTGASSGIGAEMARELGRRGHGVVLAARREGPLRALATELVGLGVRAEVVVIDVSDAAARAAIPERIADLGLTVDVLVNNAGYTTQGPVHRADPAAEIAMVRTDVEAVVDFSTRFSRQMVDHGRGAILNVASTVAFQPLPGQAGYSGSKAFVLAYTQAMRAELRGTSVTATALCPGPVRTGFIDAGGFDKEEAESALPGFLWVSAADVARAAIDGLDHDKAVVIPGAANRIGAYAGYLTPRRLLLPILARQHPSMKS